MGKQRLREDEGLGPGALERNLPVEQRPQGQQVTQRSWVCDLTWVILPLGRLRQEDCLGLQAVPGHVLSFMLDRATDTERNVMREEASNERVWGRSWGEENS